MVDNAILRELQIGILAGVDGRYVGIEAPQIVYFTSFTLHKPMEKTSHPFIKVHLVLDVHFFKQLDEFNLICIIKVDPIFSCLLLRANCFSQEFWQRSHGLSWQ